MDNTLPSDYFPLSNGRWWIYSTGSFIFSRDINISVIDRKNNSYLLKILYGKFELYAIIRSDVDLYIVAYSKNKADSIENGTFEYIPKIEILKSPVIKGTSWKNMVGDFRIVDMDYKLKVNKRTYPETLYIQVKDTSDAYNHIFLKRGVGIIFAKVYLDGIGNVYLSLKDYK